MMGQNTLLFNVVCNKTPPSLTSHACFMQRWEGKQRRINRCSILQQQLDTFQATGCTGVTQWSAPINVTSIHLWDTEPSSHTCTDQWEPCQSHTDEETHQFGLIFFFVETPTTLSHLCTSTQQQSDTLGLSLYACLMQWGDGVHSHSVDCCTLLNQLLQLESSALGSGLVNRWPVRPESKTMSCKNVKPNKDRAFVYVMFRCSGYLCVYL